MPRFNFVKHEEPPKPKGHWPKGRRRNPDGGQWSSVRLRLQKLLTDHHQPRRLSIRAVAKVVGTNERTVRRWMRGEDRPPLEAQDTLTRLVANIEKEHA